MKLPGIVVWQWWDYSPNKAEPDRFRISSSDDSSVVVLASQLFLAASLLLFKAHFLGIRPFTEQRGIKGYLRVTFFHFGKPCCWSVESSLLLIRGWTRHVTKNRISLPLEQWKLFFSSSLLNHALAHTSNQTLKSDKSKPVWGFRLDGNSGE